MHLENEAALGLPQVGLRLLVDSSSCNVNRKPQNCEGDALGNRYNWLLTSGVASPEILGGGKTF